MIGLLCCIVRLKFVIHSVHLVPATILSATPGNPPAHPAKSFITNSAIGLWQILPKHTKSIFFIALALLRYFFFQYNGVNAIAHTCYDRRMPGKKDTVSFAVTRLDEERGIAVGIITRIIKQNL